jgi:hypothetical protein
LAFGRNILTTGCCRNIHEVNIFVSKWGEAAQINIKYEDTLDGILNKYLKSINAESRKYHMSRNDWNLEIQFVLFGEKCRLSLFPNRIVGNHPPGTLELFNYHKNNCTMFKYGKKFDMPINTIIVGSECIIFSQRIYILGTKKILRNRKLGPDKNTILSM